VAPHLNQAMVIVHLYLTDTAWPSAMREGKIADPFDRFAAF